MAKLLKKWMAKELTAALTDVDSFILFGYDKITAEQAHDFRKTLKEQSIKVKAVKNTIASVVCKELFDEDLTEQLKGPTAVAYGGETPVEVAKALMEWNKKAKVLTVKGGMLAGQVLDAKKVEELSKIPPKDVLFSLLAGAMQSPAQQIATIMVAAMQDISYMLSNLTDKLENKDS